jgi:predicted nucleic acid-binding protein
LILVDANLLIYAVNTGVPRHAAAQKWLDGRPNGVKRVGLPWPSLMAFLRLATNPVSSSTDGHDRSLEPRKVLARLQLSLDPSTDHAP